MSKGIAKIAVFKGVEPIGLGTADVESLLSYLARIARIYGLTPGKIVDWYIAWLVEIPYLLKIARHGGSGLYENSTMLLSSGKVATYFSTAIGELTGQEQLDRLTTLPFATEFSHQWLIFPKRRWCPLCYQYWLSNRESIRDLLLWSIYAVSICPIHGIELQSACPACGCGSYILERKYSPGYCNHCGGWLGLRLVTPDNLPEPTEEALWKVIQARQILANVAKTEGITKQFLDDCVKACGSMKKLSRQSGFSKSTLSGWLNSVTRPSLHMLLELSWRIKRPFQNPIDYNEDKVKISKTPSENKRISGLFLLSDPVASEWEQKIWAVIADRYPPPSLAQVARELKITSRWLRSCTPDLCRMLSATYLRYKEKTRNERSDRLKREIRLTFRKLAFSGFYPGRRIIEHSTGRPALLREQAMKIEWNSCFGQLELW